MLRALTYSAWPHRNLQPDLLEDWPFRRRLSIRQTELRVREDADLFDVSRVLPHLVILDQDVHVGLGAVMRHAMLSVLRIEADYLSGSPLVQFLVRLSIGWNLLAKPLGAHWARTVDYVYLQPNKLALDHERKGFARICASLVQDV